MCVGCVCVCVFYILNCRRAILLVSRSFSERVVLYGVVAGVLLGGGEDISVHVCVYVCVYKQASSDIEN